MRTFVGSLAILFVAFVPATSWAQGVILDGDARFEYNDTAGSADLESASGGLADDALFRQWFWYRVDADPAETIMPAPATQDYTGNVATLTWSEAQFDVTVINTLTDGAGPNEVSMTQSVEITNTTGAAIDLNLFVYADFDVHGAANDSASLFASDTIQIIDDGVVASWQAIGADHYLVAPYPQITTLLDDAAINDLDDTGLPFGPADFTGAWQYTRTIDAGASVTFDVNYDVEPLPCTLGVTDLQGVVDCSAGEMTLTWLNGEAYDEIIVDLDGVTTTIGGSDTTFTGPFTSGSPVATVYGVCSSIATPSQSVTGAIEMSGLVCSGDCATGDFDVSWTNGAAYDEITVTIDGGTPIAIGGSETSYSGTAPGAGLHTIEIQGNCGGALSTPLVCSVTVPGSADNVVWAAELASDIDSVAALTTAFDNDGVGYVVVTDLVGVQACISPTQNLWVMLGTFPDNYSLDDTEGTLLRDHVLAGGNLYVEGGDTWGFDAATPLDEVDGIDMGATIDGDDTFVAMAGTAYGPVDLTGFDAPYTQDQSGSSDYTDQLVVAGDSAGPNAGVVWTEAGGAYNVGIFHDTDPGFGKVLCQSWEFGGYGGSQDDLALAYLGTYVPPVCLGVSGLSCSADCDSGMISLSWTNNDTYTSIEVERDGTVIATLGGGDTSYDDTPGDGMFSYNVRGICAAGAAAAPGCSASVFTGAGGASHVIWAAEAASDIDSVAALQAAMTDASVAFDTVADLSTLVCPAGRTLWCMTGTYPDNHPLTTDEGTIIANWISNGGHVHFEGGDTWGFDGSTDFWQYDGVDESLVADGDDTFQGMIGSDFGGAKMLGLDAVYNQDQTAGTDWTDQLVTSATDSAGPSSGVIWNDDTTGGGAGYATGIFYDTDPGNGKVIAQSWEFGGYGGDQAALLAAELAVLGGGGGPVGTQFRRGDANGDGGFDISDAVFTLSALFVAGSPALACQDAGDANDDGNNDISDAVFTLSALFVPGSPPAPAPGSTTCGTDPTDDGLGCASYSCM